MVIEFSDGNLAILPVLRNSLGGYCECMAPHVYGGPVFKNHPQEEHLQVINKVPYWFANCTLVENPFETYRREQDFLARVTMMTTATDLSPGYDSLWKKFRRNHRQNYKSAIKQGVKVDLACSKNDIDDYFNVYKNSLRRWGNNATGFYPRSLFRNMLKMPEFGKSIRMYLARKDNVAIGGIIMVYHGTQSICWHAVYHSDHLSKHAAQLLVITAIENACKEGFRWFDLMGPNNRYKQLQHFKDGFATQLLPYDAYYSNNSVRGLLFIRFRKFKEKKLRRCKM